MQPTEAEVERVGLLHRRNQLARARRIEQPRLSMQTYLVLHRNRMLLPKFP